MRLAHLVILLGMAGLAGCSAVDRDKPLRDLRTGSVEPEEFSVLPNKPLASPQSFSELPAPTPGGNNRTDLTPKADAIAALGGNPARAVATGPATAVGAGDQALVAQASRFGREGDIRDTLAAEDQAFRRSKNIFNWSIVPRDNYERAYSRSRLEPYRWLRRYRQAGAQTPAAPPGG